MNATELRNDLIDVYEKLKDGKISRDYAVSMSRVAGNIINSAKLQLKYASQRGEIPNIPFIDDDK